MEIISAGRNHISGLEGFRSCTKKRFLKYHGLSKNHFYLCLKEMGFRYHHRNENIYKSILIISNPNLNSSHDLFLIIFKYYTI